MRKNKKRTGEKEKEKNRKSMKQSSASESNPIMVWENTK